MLHKSISQEILPGIGKKVPGSLSDVTVEYNCNSTQMDVIPSQDVFKWRQSVVDGQYWAILHW